MPRNDLYATVQFEKGSIRRKIQEQLQNCLLAEMWGSGFRAFASHQGVAKNIRNYYVQLGFAVFVHKCRVTCLYPKCYSPC